MSEEVFCKVFADTLDTTSDLMEELEKITQGEVKFDVIYMNDTEIELRENEDYDATSRRDFPDGFLYFSHYIEIVSETIVTQKPIVTNLLKHLWQNGVPAIASCDYEDQLPENGGYKSKKIPWPTLE